MRAKRYAERAEALRGGHASVDAVYVIADRDSEIGGGLMAGALAYRIFIWLLPFALVVVAGIGIASSASESPESAAKSLGLQGVVASSVAQAARGSSRWYALLIGVPILLWATRNLLKALVVVHRLVWGDLRRAVPKPTAGATLWFLALLVGYFVILELARGSRIVDRKRHAPAPGRLPRAHRLVGAWSSMRLPAPRCLPGVRLVPGAVVMAIGLELISSIGAFLIAPAGRVQPEHLRSARRRGALLFGLYLDQQARRRLGRRQRDGLGEAVGRVRRLAARAGGCGRARPSAARERLPRGRAGARASATRPVVRLVAQAQECGSGESYVPIDVNALFDEPTVALRGPWSGDNLVKIGAGGGRSHRVRYEYHLDFPGNALDPGCDYERWARHITEGQKPTVYAHVATEPAPPGQALPPVLVLLRLQRLEQHPRGRLGDDPARLRRGDARPRR